MNSKTNQIAQYIEWFKKAILAMDDRAQIGIANEQTNTIDFVANINNETIFVQCKTQVRPLNVAQIEKQLQSYYPNENHMVIANYITPKAKEILKEKNIAYLDEGGNIFLRLENYVLQREGLKTKSEPENQGYRAFTKTGARVVFQLLVNPQLINASQRELAKRAGVSLGTIPKVLKQLLRDKYAVRLTETTYELINKEQLLNKWVEAFASRLLPSLYMRTFTPRNMSMREYFQKATMHSDTVWGGEAAAALITNYIHPEEYTIYTELTGGELMRLYELVPSNEGEITAYQKFWESETSSKPHVHPIITYAELVASGDSRNLEVAEQLLNEHIRPNL
jgi:hypothetical protein